MSDKSQPLPIEFGPSFQAWLLIAEDGHRLSKHEAEALRRLGARIRDAVRDGKIQA